MAFRLKCNMEHDISKKTVTRSVLLAGIVIAFVVGVVLGPKIRLYVSSRSLTDAQSVESVITKSEQFSLLTRVWNILDTSFIADRPAADDKLYGMIKGLVASYGDPYTEFFDPKEAKEFSEEVGGAFEGVGMEVDKKDGVIVVIAPLKNTPAYNAGIKAGDIIVKIDGEPATNMSLEEAIQKMRGKKGTHVILTIMREGEAEPREVDIERDTISVPSIDVVKKDGIRIVSLYTFTENSYTDFKSAIDDYDPAVEKGLIIDLRANPGGYLDAATDIGSLFVPAGKVIVREKSRDESEVVHRSKGVKSAFQDAHIPVVILVDGGSASASEILAGALHEHNIATLVGTQTYGKGSVQEYQELPLGTSIKVTVAQWYTPEGVSISKEGLKPDVIIPFDVASFQKNKTDNQLQKAIEIITKKQ